LTGSLIPGYLGAMRFAPPAQPRRTRQASEPEPAFQEFQASVLFCNRCGSPQPVRERLLLHLPNGELWEYLCTACGQSLGTRRTGA
jgi:hypothetical protein